MTPWVGLTRVFLPGFALGFVCGAGLLYAAFTWANYPKGRA